MSFSIENNIDYSFISKLFLSSFIVMRSHVSKDLFRSSLIHIPDQWDDKSILDYDSWSSLQ